MQVMAAGDDDVVDCATAVHLLTCDKMQVMAAGEDDVVDCATAVHLLTGTCDEMQVMAAWGGDIVDCALNNLPVTRCRSWLQVNMI
jgi:hypothetical protein